MNGTLLPDGRGSASEQKGVTLIELLVAITLLSLLSLGLLMTLRVGLNAMDKANAKLMANRRVASVERIMRSEIQDLIPVVANCVPEAEQPPEALMYFDGRPQSLRFVSSYSLQEASRGEPRILDFQVIPGDRGRGVRLVVNELIYSPRQAGATCVGSVPDPDRGVAMGAFRPIQVGPGTHRNSILPSTVSSRFSSTSALLLALAYPPYPSCDPESDFA